MYIDVTGWSALVNYETFDIVYISGNNFIDYYYATQPSFGKSPLAWTGYWTKDFPSKPDFQTSFSLNFDVAENGGVEVPHAMAFPQNVNTETIKGRAIFKNRSDAEARAIIHYVERKGGVTPFYMDIGIGNMTGLFFNAFNLQHTFSYNNLNNISFEFEQFHGFDSRPY